ncbi:hypothetical protein E5345_09835 [Propionibacterium sp. NM47_B9-13]|nr:hypothetical protein CP877_12700 [Cutibacterium modestum]TGY28400.1 hypothetical protein E5345_09835 [Propionibacterium sp. NM47_B9-13]
MWADHFYRFGASYDPGGPGPTPTDSCDPLSTQSVAIVMVAERCAEIRTVTFIFRRRHVLSHDG